MYHSFYSSTNKIDNITSYMDVSQLPINKLSDYGLDSIYKYLPSLFVINFQVYIIYIYIIYIYIIYIYILYMYFIYII
jgi:hypothetical protein